MARGTTKNFVGYTTEGHPFHLVAFFEGDTELPVRVVGSYSSSDGGGHFNVENERDIPWVVYDGEWHLVR